MSDMLSTIPLASVLLPLIGAALAPVLPRHKKSGADYAARLTCFIVLTVAVVSLILLPTLIYGALGVHAIVTAGGELQAGPLEVLFALTFSLVMLLVLLGNMRSMHEDVHAPRHAPYQATILLLFSGLMAMVYANNLLTAWIAIEVVLTAACALTAAKSGGDAARAAVRLLVMSAAGSSLILIAICLLYALTGTLDFPGMKVALSGLLASNQNGLQILIALNLIVMGLAIKSALYPFSTWLPEAHGSTTNASSAMLSGLVTKGHIILILKILFRVMDSEAIRLLRIDQELLVLGLCSMIAGSLYALRQVNIKHMIAWSSVAQVGYIFLGIGMNTEAAIAGACLHIIVHATVKPMLVTSAGGLIDVSGHRKNFRALKGSFYRNRWAGLGLVAGACSMMGVPSFAGFASKLSLTLAALDSPAIIQALAALTLSSVLNALYYVPAMIVILTPNEGGEHVRTQTGVMFQWVMAIFLTATFFLGLYCIPVLRIIELGLSAF